MSITTPRIQDPICGMIVPLDTEFHTEYQGETVFFCSDHCRQKFISHMAGAQIDAQTLTHTDA